jgi:hypothetical protein
VTPSESCETSPALDGVTSDSDRGASCEVTVFNGQDSSKETPRSSATTVEMQVRMPHTRSGRCLPECRSRSATATSKTPASRMIRPRAARSSLAASGCSPGRIRYLPALGGTALLQVADVPVDNVPNGIGEVFGFGLLKGQPLRAFAFFALQRYTGWRAEDDEIGMPAVMI